MPRGENKELGKSGDPLVVSAMGAGALFAALVATVGGWIGYSALRVSHKYPLSHALDGERRTFVSPSAGTISYYVDRKKTGRPLVLAHGIDVTASAYEMRPLFEHYRTSRPVFALDLPGFGFSERSNRTYTPGLLVQAVLDLVQMQIRSAEPADVIALGAGAEVAASAVQSRPDLFRSLTLISPTGLDKRRSRRPHNRQYWLMSFPLWSQAVFDGFVTRASIQLALRQRFQGLIDPEFAEYAYATSHQPGGRYAPLHFLSGKLSVPDIRVEVYEQLMLPVLVLYDRDPVSRFDALPGLLANHHNWQAVRIAPTKGLPHFERLPETAQALDKFWEDA